MQFHFNKDTSIFWNEKKERNLANLYESISNAWSKMICCGFVTVSDVLFYFGMISSIQAHPEAIELGWVASKSEKRGIKYDIAVDENDDILITFHPDGSICELLREELY